jgi:serine/threonine protein phosphatase PrpC
MKVGRRAGLTDTGRRRLRNEDAFVCEPPLFAVADGMGGARAGEVAARLAATALEEAGSETRGAAGIAALLEEANRRIFERSLSDPDVAGMGTTVTAALVDSAAETVSIGHVGDSRAYRLRQGELEQLTTDHSLVAELVESGLLTPEEAERHPQRSAITRALGTDPTVEIDAFTVDAAAGDVFLLCSDGLSAMLADDEVAALVGAANGDLTRASRDLVAAANERGGEDNVTVILFELIAGDVAADTEVPSARPETESLAKATVAFDPPPPEPEAEPSAAGTLRRHGAGPGGRVGALLLIVAVVGVCLLVLYLGISR